MFQDKITDIFFDLDHTLWDFDKNSELAFEKIFKENHPAINTKLFVDIYAPINQACWKLYQVDKLTHDELRYKRLKDSFDFLSYSISDEEINQMSIDYITYLPENNILFDGAKEVLDYLNSKYRLHIITNGFAEVQYKKLKNSGISDYFISVTNSEKAGVKKPHPKIFEFALSLANTQKERSIMIGDCIDADVKGALNFGMEAIYFNDKNVQISNDIIQVNQLIELKKYF
ncbi:YjjG family noncanonical pyrimidine nucleotidase [Flavobacterium sp.]|uniref:YjjG family noncanonical pyrimidine nucleotidase n=1 Tax=Flavobacterium sp. TaxID=239 RepID=UPI00263961A4|nr:YjjG family noncanonical pyrimidine nucleotidase [Flavobacterium sp.]